MGHFSKQVLVSAMLAAAVYTGSASLAAQEQGAQAPSTSPSDAVSTPRPKIDHDATVPVLRGSYGLRIYFQENRTAHTLNDSHVFYEPLIYLLTNDQGRFLHRFDNDGNGTTLTLYFRVETDGNYIEDETRKQLAKNVSNRSLANNLINRSIRFNLTALPLQVAWFESSKSDGVRSQDLAPGPIVATAPIPIHFRFPTQQKAEAFVDGLFDPPGSDTLAEHSLVFRYRFSGVGQERCNGQYKAEYAQAADLDKELTGTGGEGYVTRDQAVKLADKMVSKVKENITCSDPKWATYIRGQLLSRFGGSTISLDSQKGWELLDRYMKLDENSFKADVTTKIKDIKKEAVRSLVSEATSKAWSEAGSQSGSGGFAGGWGPVMASASASFAKADSETGAEAVKAFSDIMRKSGILVEWEGKKYDPKSVEVYNVANMQRNLSQDFEINYTFKADNVSKSHAIILTADSFKNNKNLAERLRQRIQDLEAEKEAGITQARANAEKALQWAEAAMWDARKAIQTATYAETKASIAEEIADTARSVASDTNENVKSIVISFYKFKNLPKIGKFVTGYKINDFPFAHIAQHELSCEYRHSHIDKTNKKYTGKHTAKLPTLNIYNENGFWTIYARRDRFSCDSLIAIVAYYRGSHLLRNRGPILSNNSMKKNARPMKLE